jgi:hypothetical protein
MLKNSILKAEKIKEKCKKTDCNDCHANVKDRYCMFDIPCDWSNERIEVINKFLKDVEN